MSSPSQGKMPALTTAQELIDQAGDLATCPAIFTRLMECMDDPDVNFQEIGTVIQTDPALTTQVLRMVNSPFYGLSEKVASITHAIQIMGTHELSSIVLATCVISHFKGIPENLVTLEGFWYQSIGTAITAAIISEHHAPEKKPYLYTGGMIHDLGSLLIYTHLPEQATQALERCNEWGKEFTEAEKEALGFTHEEVGALIAERWALPELLKTIMAHHHAPLEAPRFQHEVAVVRLADYIASNLQLGTTGEHLVREPAPELMEKLEVTPEVLKTISDKTLLACHQAFETLYPGRRS